MTQDEQITKLINDNKEISSKLRDVIDIQNELTTLAAKPNFFQTYLQKVTLKDMLLGLVAYLAASAHITDNTLHDVIIAFLNGL